MGKKRRLVEQYENKIGHLSGRGENQEFIEFIVVTVSGPTLKKKQTHLNCTPNHVESSVSKSEKIQNNIKHVHKLYTEIVIYSDSEQPFFLKKSGIRTHGRKKRANQI